MNQRILIFSTSVFLCGVSFCAPWICADTSASPVIGSFTDSYEPSAVVQLPSGTIMLVDDEGDSPLRTLEFSTSEKRFIQDTRQLRGFDGVVVDDLEGVAMGKGGQVFLVASHSLTKKGKRKQARERLIRFEIQGEHIQKQRQVKNLLPHIRQQLSTAGELQGKSLEEVNIEGLAFDPTGEKLLLGLRAPLDDNKSIILVIDNPHALFDGGQEPRFGKLLTLDMGGAGIRAMTYDHKLDSYLLVNEAMNNKGKLRPTLWAWGGTPDHQPVRIRMPKLKGVDNVEGITAVTFNGKDYILLVCDDGDKEVKQGAHYVLFDRRELTY